VASFRIHLLQIGKERRVAKAVKGFYRSLQKQNIEVLYDDREDKTPGEKFAEADLIGIPWRAVISEKTLKKNSVELKERNKKSLRLVKINQAAKYAK